MHETLRMFVICEAMRWANLPVDGGIYDQHPAFLDGILICWEQKGKAQKRKDALEKAKASKGSTARGRRGRR